MITANGKILVSVDFSQKNSVAIAGSTILIAKDFSTNRRESNPVICQVIDGNGKIADGTFLLVHHGRFTEFSPHHLEDNLYSLAYNSSIFAKIDEQGNAIGLCDNIIVERIYENDSPLIPQHLKKVNKFKYKVLSNGFGFKEGQFVFCYEFADYEIVYVWKGVEKRVVKVIKNDVVGKMTN